MDGQLSHDELSAVFDAGVKLTSLWPMMLDSFDAIVEQTKARGFTEEQARALVVSMFKR